MREGVQQPLTSSQSSAQVTLSMKNMAEEMDAFFVSIGVGKEWVKLIKYEKK